MVAPGAGEIEFATCFEIYHLLGSSGHPGQPYEYLCRKGGDGLCSNYELRDLAWRLVGLLALCVPHWTGRISG
jgi:hypothetical protein